jgi:hypothetical protein
VANAAVHPGQVRAAGVERPRRRLDAADRVAAGAAEAVGGHQPAACQGVAVPPRRVERRLHVRPALRHAVAGDEVPHERLQFGVAEGEARHAHLKVGAVRRFAAGDGGGEGRVGELVADAVEGRRRQRGYQRGQVRVAFGHGRQLVGQERG